MVANNEVDIAAATLTMTLERIQSVDFTVTLDEETIDLIIRKALDKEFDFGAYYSLISYDCWIAIFVFVLLLSSMIFTMVKDYIQTVPNLS